jgi:hypothetical protein
MRRAPTRWEVGQQLAYSSNQPQQHLAYGASFGAGIHSDQAQNNYANNTETENLGCAAGRHNHEELQLRHAHCCGGSHDESASHTLADQHAEHDSRTQIQDDVYQRKALCQRSSACGHESQTQNQTQTQTVWIGGCSCGHHSAENSQDHGSCLFEVDMHLR